VEPTPAASPATPAESNWTRGRRGIHLAILILAACAAFWPAFGAGFVYDDNAVVLRNPAVVQFDVVGHWTRPMWEFQVARDELAGGHWRPLTMLLLSAAYAVAGPSALAFHVFALALHLIASIAAWALARRLAGSDAVGWAVALLFALHPVHVESVAWISALGDPACGALALFALERHLAWRQRGAQGSPWAAATLLLAALLTQEVAAGAFLGVIAIDLALARARTPNAYRPYLAVLALWWLARVLVFQSAWGGLDRPTTEYGVPTSRLVLLRGEFLGRALERLAWPADLRLFHAFVPDAARAQLAIPFAFLAAWIVLCVWLARRRERVLLAAALLTLAPLLLLVVRVGSLGQFPFSERSLYLAVFGFVATLVLAARRWLPAPIASAGLLLVAGAFGVLTQAQARTWHDEESLLRTAAERGPRVPYARWQYGRVLLERYRATHDLAALEAAEREFQEAVALLSAARTDGSIFAVRDDHVQAHVGLGWVLLYGAEAEGDRSYQDASNIFRMVTATYPRSSEGWTGLGIAELSAGNVAAARTALERALAENDRSVEAHRNLGRLWFQQGDWARAQTSFETALRWQPDQVDTLLLLGSTRERAGDDAQARQHFDRAAALAPLDARPRVQIAILMAKAARWEEAAREIGRAIELDPRSAEAHVARGKIQAARGEKHGALLSFQRAADLAPLSFESHYNAGVLANELEGVPQAMPYLIRAYENRPDAATARQLADFIRSLSLASPEAFLLLATADADHGDVDSALAWLADVLTMQPEHGGAYFLKGGMLEQKGDLTGARAAWEKAATLLPESFAVHRSLGGLLERLGDREGAIRHLETALKLLERAASSGGKLEMPIDMLRAKILKLREGR